MQIESAALGSGLVAPDLAQTLTGRAVGEVQFAGILHDQGRRFSLHVLQRMPSNELLAVDEALDPLAAKDPTAADLVRLKYFVGMTMEEAAAAPGLSLRNAERIRSDARDWLRRKVTAVGA